MHKDLADFPVDLEKKRVSERRLKELIPFIRAVRSGYSLREGPEETYTFQSLHDFQENTERILCRLREKIAEEEAVEELEGLQSRVARFRFPSEIKTLMRKAKIERSSTIAKNWQKKYQDTYDDWSALIGDLERTATLADADLPDDLEAHIDKIWETFTSTRPPENSTSARDGAPR